jgi:tellurite resistance protein TehA-like permease
MYLGTGVMMWGALFTIWLYRSIFHHPPPGRLLAATWINFTPPSIAPMAYEMLLGMEKTKYWAVMNAVSKSIPPLASYLQSFFDMFYYTLWGLAGLLFPVVLLVTFHYWRKGELRFAESWWAFVFPVAAYSISTLHLYLHHPEEVWLLWYAGALYALAWFFYAVTTALSVLYGIEELKGEKPPSIATPFSLGMQKGNDEALEGG